ncbi:MAG TPA: hypothetical protein VH722_04500 [Alphaproteobacteria bacterium]|jgi:hypothetical protein|nr:hypothetical protein [Alphaproteobacteria bacterium]
MPDYRLYFLDSDGKISHAVELQCPDDDSAIQLVSSHADGRDMELWSLKRCIRAFPGGVGLSPAAGEALAP